jgi:hypothetical protein
MSSTKTRFNTINDEHYIIGPTVILDLLLKHLLLRYPIMLPILQKFNCYHIAQATVSDPIVKNRIQQGPFLSFLQFLIRVVIYFEPNHFRYLWTLLSDSYMLIKNKGMLLPISIEFRKVLIQETILQLKITIEKIHSKYHNGTGTGANGNTNNPQKSNSENSGSTSGDGKSK